MHVGHVCFQPHKSCTLPLDSVSPCNRCLYSLFTVCTYICIYFLHIYIQYVWISWWWQHIVQCNEHHFRVKLAKLLAWSLNILSFTLLVPSFFSIPDTIWFWAECCDQVKDTEKVVQAKMYLGASQWIISCSLFEHIWWHFERQKKPNHRIHYTFVMLSFWP